MSHHQSHIDDRVISMIIMDKTIHLHMSGSVCHARCPLLDLSSFQAPHSYGQPQKSSDSHQAVIRQSLGSHQAVIRLAHCPLLDLQLFRLFTAADSLKSSFCFVVLQFGTKSDNQLAVIMKSLDSHLHMSGSVCHARCPLLDLYLFQALPSCREPQKWLS